MTPTAHVLTVGVPLAFLLIVVPLIMRTVCEERRARRQMELLERLRRRVEEE